MTTESAATLAAVGPVRAPAHDPISGVSEFDRLYHENSETVFRYAWMLTQDHTAAEDVTADVFLRAWRNRDSFRGDGSPTSWLLSITYNCAMSARRRNREVAGLDFVAAVADGSLAPEESMLAADEAGRVHSAIRLLTPEQQQVILLRFFEGLPHEQVAEVMDRAPNAVRALQFRALRRLRTLLEAANA